MKYSLLFLFSMFPLLGRPLDEAEPSREHIKGLIGMSELLIEKEEFLAARNLLKDVLAVCPYPWLAFKACVLIGQLPAD